MRKPKYKIEQRKTDKVALLLAGGKQTKINRAKVTDKTLKPSIGVILKCEFDQNTGFFYVGFEGVDKSLGGKFSPETLRHMITYMENKLQGAL